MKLVWVATGRPPSHSRRFLPPMEEVHRELRRKGVTLQLLWEEYHRAHPDGYAYTQFCEYYRRFCSQLEPALRQPHPAGERMFVDWAGMTVLLWNANTGQSHPVYLFVAVLGASNYTFAAAFANMRLTAWIEAHMQAWEFFGGVTRLTVPDNPKTTVTYALEVVSFDDAAAGEYGALRQTLERQGQLIGSMDLLIAAQALALGVTLVTNNEKEFQRVPGLKIENWTR